MILKALLVGAVIYIVYIMFFKQKNVEKSSTTAKKKEQKPQANEMVECANCGVYVEISESILSSGKYYCSDECIKKAGK
ncbi:MULTISPECIES: PP0621 family protein [Sulfurimonas]|uniref:PP0621 family protein n=1 Tax=Sulfurimonas TaxID=202746 RepID=UPI001264C6D1|nr:PP0621 family protein [Sulfurimonas indica]